MHDESTTLLWCIYKLYYVLAVVYSVNTWSLVCVNFVFTCSLDEIQQLMTSYYYSLYPFVRISSLGLLWFWAFFIHEWDTSAGSQSQMWKYRFLLRCYSRVMIFCFYYTPVHSCSAETSKIERPSLVKSRHRSPTTKISLLHDRLNLTFGGLDFSVLPAFLLLSFTTNAVASLGAEVRDKDTRLPSWPALHVSFSGPYALTKQWLITWFKSRHRSSDLYRDWQPQALIARSKRILVIIGVAGADSRSANAHSP